MIKRKNKDDFYPFNWYIESDKSNNDDTEWKIPTKEDMKELKKFLKKSKNDMREKKN